MVYCVHHIYEYLLIQTYALLIAIMVKSRKNASHSSTELKSIIFSSYYNEAANLINLLIKLNL